MKVRDGSELARAEMILFPKRLRLEWVELMALDVRISPADLRVGCVIGIQVNEELGVATLSQQALTKLTKMHLSTVARSITKLETYGYLMIERFETGCRKDGRKAYGGRGRANQYCPTIEGVQTSVRGKMLVESAEQNQEGDTCYEGGTKRNRRPLTKQVTAEELSDDESLSLPPEKHLTSEMPTPCSRPENNCPGTTDALGTFGDRLRTTIGLSMYKAWFSKVAIEELSDKSVTLNAPNRFFKDYITNQFTGQLLRAFQTTYPNLTRILIVVRNIAGNQGNDG